MRARVVLKPGKDKLLRRGYPWVFANQLHRIEGEPRSGDVVEITAADGTTYGLGFYHEHSQIAVRFLTPDPNAQIDAGFFRRRLERALALRQAAFGDSTHYRLVFSESDGLPGTIIDRYGDVLTWTCLCYGMEQRRELLLDLLEELLRPRAIIERNDHALREKDGLPQRRGVLRGQYGGPVEIVEEGVRFRVDVLEGLKTGFFLDQRLHRPVVARLARGRRVLDVFSADGGFGLMAAAHGAAHVHLLDISETAMERARTNARLNGLDTNRLTFDVANALDRLGELVAQGATYELIVLDPPAFARSKRHLDDARRAYQRINISALRLLPPGGLLATASCSQAVDEATFLKIIHYSARRAGCALRLLYRGTQPPDHPVLEAMPETAYLKFFLFQKLTDETPPVRQ
ncbi:class I SAM-dependent rRNA methyltransferase [Rhodothermus profundi]|uniref:SAM-dependent methyltransferase n=1 Tax=Rhodothermus profundi TaxID=633813 RepID=A0A1M6PZA5_9BACT|nr:class I SAM-dependent rRNA methyltransferase [Rhodothermus profundi]SHK13241.1 SAM-dependent methyltransferase [Rhodothermus profundi]